MRHTINVGALGQGDNLLPDYTIVAIAAEAIKEIAIEGELQSPM